MLGPTLRVEDVQVGHARVRRNERYEFPTSATCTLVQQARRAGKRKREEGNKGQSSAYEAKLKRALGGLHIVRSTYGSPYECTYDLSTLRVEPKTTDAGDAEFADDARAPTTRITCRGVAVRRRDIPTAAQEAAAAARESGAEEKAKDLRRRATAQGLRVVNSRFGTSTCAACGVAITPRQQIARPKAADAQGARGGWMHIQCALQAKPERRRSARQAGGRM